jgi:hypothetical protein
MVQQQALSRDKWKEFPGFTMLSSLREGQSELVSSFLQALDTTNPYGGIISMPTGGGKTVLGITIASILKMPTLVVVPRSVLVEQWRQRILEHTNCTEADIGVVRQGVCNFRGKKVVIGLVHSLAQREYAEELYSNFGLVIFDEVHTMGAETFSTVAHKFDSPVRLGLSATVRRKDGMANVFLWHIGPIVSVTRTLKIRPKVLQLRYYNAGSSHDRCMWQGRLILPRYLNRIAALPSRNAFLAELLEALFKKDHHILLLSDRMNMLTAIQQILISKIGRDKVGLFVGKEKDLNKQILLGTFGSADMGADIPRLTALVLASPRTDIVQPVGRVLRQGEPIVVDIVDTASGIMQGWAHARMRYYRQIATVIKTKEYRA